MRAARRSVRLIASAIVLAGVLTTAAPDAPSVAAALEPDPQAALAAGSAHQCALLADQTVECWGNNRFGQLGNNSTTDSLTPVAVVGLSGVVAIDAGRDFTCALRSDGTVACWGSNLRDALGIDSVFAFHPAPVTLAALSDVVQIATGDEHGCARLANGELRCWGAGGSGRLGNGGNTDAPLPVAVNGIADAAVVAAGRETTCAIRSAQALWCWGDNDSGQFGDGTTTSSNTPVGVPAAGSVVDVEIGNRTTCVIDDSDRMRCVGSGPLGDGSGASSTSWTDVSLGPVTQMMIGPARCAVTSDASLWCWTGSSGFGPAFLEDPNRSPRRVDGVDDVTAVAGSFAHICAGSADGSVRCWGLNFGGQLGESVIGHTFPGADFGVTASDLAVHNKTCAVTQSAEMTCAGIDFSDLFSGEPIDLVGGAKPVEGVADAVEADVSTSHSCVRHTDGTVSCWGVNIAGAVGVPPDPSSPFPYVPDPTTVAGISGANDVATGNSFSCAIAGALPKCWGRDEVGQLGDDAAFVDSVAPVDVAVPPLTTGATLLDAGNNHACASFNIAFFAPQLHCWGSNGSGQLGDGTTDDRPISVPTTPSILFPIAIGAGQDHTCAINSVNDLWCWGRNDDAQLGIGTTSPSESTPQQVTGFPSPPIDVVGGDEHTCALLTNQQVACWGSNERYQAGTAIGQNKLVPFVVPGLSGVKAIDAGTAHTCAILNDDSVTCWGDNTFGQAGDLPYFPDPLEIGVGAVYTAGSTIVPIWEPVDPARLLETRNGLTTVDGESQGGGAIRGDTQIEVQVAGRAGVPADADFALVNLTAVQPAGVGFLTAHACLSPRPVIASLNYTNQPGVGPINLGNESVVELSSSGSICVYTSTTTELTIDVMAFGRSLGGYGSSTPARLLESRPGESTIDGQAELGARIDGGTEVVLQVGGRGGVPDWARAAVLYIAAVNPTGIGFVTAHPCLDDPPTTSSLNYTAVPGGPGITRGNEVIAPLSDDGTICLFVSTTTDLTVDVVGAIGGGTTQRPLDPLRIMETRAGLDTIDGQAELGAPIPAGSTYELVVAGRGGVATTARSAILNITAVRPSGIGFVTAHPCSDDLPTASSLNFTALAATGPINGGNEVVVPLSSAGTVCLYVSTRTDLTVDIVGYT